MLVSSINVFLLNKPTCDGCRGLRILVMSPAVSGDVYRGLPLASACSLVAVHTYRQSLLRATCLSPLLLPSSPRCVLLRGHCSRRAERPRASPRSSLPRPRFSQPTPGRPPPPAQFRHGPHLRAWRRVLLSGGLVPPVPLASPPRLRPRPAY